MNLGKRHEKGPGELEWREVGDVYKFILLCACIEFFKIKTYKVRDDCCCFLKLNFTHKLLRFSELQIMLTDIPRYPCLASAHVIILCLYSINFCVLFCSS